MDFKSLLLLDLLRFDGGGAAGAEGGEGGDAADTNMEFADHEAEAEPEVIYGKQDDSGEAADYASQTDEGNQEGEPIDYNAKFEELLQDENYKQIYGNRVKDAIDRRFKDVDALRSSMDAASSVIDPLMQLYGIEDGNMDALREAVFRDNNMVEELAGEQGLTVEQYLEQQDQQRRLQELEAAEQERQRQEAVGNIMNEWTSQIPEVQKDYPDFDMEKEVTDPVTGQKFQALMQTPGMTLRDAYESVHIRDLMNRTAQSVAQQTRQNTINTIRTRGARPAENGMNKSPAVIRKTDVNKFSDADIDEVNRRVMRGEKIVF